MLKRQVTCGIIAIRAVQAIGGDGDHHQGGVAGTQRGIIQPQGLHVRRSMVMDEDIRLRGQTVKDLLTGGRMQIKHHGALGGIEVGKGPAGLG